MEYHQLNIPQEKSEIDNKIKRLDEFIEREALNIRDKVDLELMTRQREIMFNYSIILGARMQRFGNDNEMI